MIGCLRTRVRKQPIIALYFESDTVLNFYNLEARSGFPLFLHMRKFYLSYPVPTHGKDETRTASRRKTSDVVVMLKGCIVIIS